MRALPWPVVLTVACVMFYSKQSCFALFLAASSLSGCLPACWPPQRSHQLLIPVLLHVLLAAAALLASVPLLS